MTKQQQLDELKKLIKNRDICSQLASQATQLVFGTGNPNANVVLIGEAPGKNEDLSGEPFVGAAGKFLDEMLASVALKREDIYITNIVKYRPPENRDPLPSEKAEFWPYLLKQLSIIQPQIIVTLGRHSGQAFIQDLRISADHGNPKRLNVVFTNQTAEEEEKKHLKMTFVILPLYHPAAALYNGSLRTTLLEDFQRIKQLILETEKGE